MNDEKIRDAIDTGGGQTCDIDGVLRELDKAGYVIVPKKDSTRACLEAIAWQIQRWLDWNAAHHGLATGPFKANDGTYIMILPVPFWPNREQLKSWIKTLRDAATLIDKV